MIKFKRLFAAMLIAATAACLAFGLAGCHKKSTHTHQLNETAATAATCTKEGNTAYWYCDGCEKYFADSEAKTETTLAATVLAATGHTSASANNAVAATCTTDGKESDTICSVCHVTLTTGATIKATGHKNLTATAAKEATCTEEGNSAYWYCSDCEKYFADSEAKTETTLDKTVIKANGHTTTKTEAKAPTCTEVGNIEYRYCSSCQKYFSDEACTEEVLQENTLIAAKGHKLTENTDSKYLKSAATCTQAAVYYKSCEDCGTASATETFAYGDKSNHTYVNGNCSGCGAAAPYTRVDADGNVSTTGSYILFGSYPQSKVTDSSLCNTLPTVANSTGTLPTASNANGWTDYGYYISGSVTSYMWYIDATYNGEKYRGVYFTSYRPYYTSYSSSTGNTNQDDNGYSTSTVYWFKYEPIKWRILTESNGTAMLLAEMIIDSQEYYNKASSGTTRSRTAVANYNDAYYAGNGTTVSGSVYDNNYQYSNVRKWLNETFYATAFSDLQKALIATTTVNNSAATTTDANGNITQATSYACSNTNDKVFLLSEKEVTTTSYGFASYSTNDTARQKKTTAYAQCQGAYTYSTTGYTYTGCGWWWLRSPYSDYSYLARRVDCGGYASVSSSVYSASEGVVSALNIRL